jgi:DNA-binding transcriptional ArsR family regulator
MNDPKCVAVAPPASGAGRTTRVLARADVGALDRSTSLSANAYLTTLLFGQRVEPEVCMPDIRLTTELLELIADRFKVLAEPARLHILNALRGGEMTVSELMEETGLGQANASKHLQVLHGLGFVERRKEGLYVHYRLADDSVFQLCDIMCGRLLEEARHRNELLGSV